MAYEHSASHDSSHESLEFVSGQSGSDDDDLDYYGDLSYEGYDFSVSDTNPVLLKDIELLKKGCSSDCSQFLSYRCFNEINELDIDIPFSTSVLEKTVADGWGLFHQEPIIVRFNVNQRHYLAVNSVNKIDVFQKSSPKRNGVLAQLKNIVEEFCRKRFRELTNEVVRAATTGTSNEALPKEMEGLLDMGFKYESVKQAYKLGFSTEETALNFLLDDYETGNSKAESASSLQPHDYFTFRDQKEYPSLRKGFLVQLYHYVQQRLLTLNDYCPICDNPHMVTLKVMLKPVVCNNPLCIFSYQTLGVMADAADSICTQPEVVDLLIRLTEAAVLSSRHDTILTPYPTVVHPTEAQELVLSEKQRDHATLKTILSKMPKIELLSQEREPELRQKMDTSHILSYPLLRWIISSNRSHIVKLPLEKQLSFMGTKHQFLLRNSPPVEDMRFRAYQRKYGSVFAFHGSPIENWHSIIREGLMVASGTKRQMHGAAYGKGIYLSPTLSTSFNYSRMYEGRHHDQTEKKKPCRKEKEKKCVENGFIQGDSKTLTCIALCEVINCPELKRHGRAIWTCCNSQYICTRFFFVYDKQFKAEVLDTGVDMNSAKLIEEVRMAIANEVKAH